MEGRAGQARELRQLKENIETGPGLAPATS